MDVVSLCPLPVQKLAFSPAPGRHAFVVVAKATFALEPGVSPLAKDQEPLRERESHWEDDPKRSLYAPADLVPAKPRAEVMLVGSAYAPQQQPVRSLVVRLRVGSVDKSIEVFCPRVCTRDGEVREGKRWTKMPLLYERAAGGRDIYGQIQLPNLQPPGITAKELEGIDPIGFGPLAAVHSQAAPPDQQLDSLRPDERITLDNLHPKHARIVTKLPDLEPRAFLEIHGAPSREIAFTADTLWIDTQRAICTLTFRARIDVEEADPDGRVLVATCKPEQKIAWARIAPPMPAPRAPAKPKTVPPVIEDRGPDSEEAIEITHTEWSDAEDTEVLRARLPAQPALPFTAGPPLSDSAKIATQKLDMSALRPSLPAWLDTSPPAPPRVAPPPMLGPPPPLIPPPAPVFGRAPSSAPPPPPLIEAPLGVLESSNAAAGAIERMARVEADPAPVKPAMKGIELIWFDPALPPRLGRLGASVYDALARGTPASSRELEAAMEAAEDGDPPSPPLVLMSGDLEPSLDEGAMLEAVVSAASPLAGSDKKLKEVLDLAAQTLETPLKSVPEVAEGLSARIREAWNRANKLLPSGHLTACTERLLLEQRRYQQRELLDDTWIRALLSGPGLDAPIPTYLPARIARRLPLFRRFTARLLAEVIWQQDQYETHPLALRVLALGRVPVRVKTRR